MRSIAQLLAFYHNNNVVVPHKCLWACLIEQLFDWLVDGAGISDAMCWIVTIKLRAFVSDVAAIGTLITPVAETDGTFTLAPKLWMQKSFEYRNKVLASRANQEEQEQWVKYELPSGKDTGRYTVTGGTFFENVSFQKPEDGIIAKMLISNGLETEPTDNPFERMLTENI